MMSESRANPGAPPALPAGTMAFGEDAIIGEPPKLPHVLKKECSYDKAKTAGISPCAPNDDANKIFTAQEMESLFVDASFFSKLGFLQPPSCMTCAHRHAHQGTDYRRSPTRKCWCPAVPPTTRQPISSPSPFRAPSFYVSETRFSTCKVPNTTRPNPSPIIEFNAG